jgi:hypothetical protein
VDSIIDQVDVLNIYLNGYYDTPQFLDNSKIRVMHSSAHGDLRDNGKFFFLDSVLDGYHFTIDDDIIYPPDYVQKIVLKIEQYDRQALIGCHGVYLADPFVRFMDGRKVLHFKRSLDRDRFVNLLGTGTVAYHTTTLHLTPADFREPGMADVWFAIAARRQQVPLIAVQRPNQWLVPLAEADHLSLFATAKRADHVQTQAIKNEGTWNLEELYASSPLVLSLTTRFTDAELDSQGVDIDFIVRCRTRSERHQAQVSCA